MKKSLILLTAALSFGVAAAQDTTAPATTTPATTPAATPAPAQAPTLTDVPAGHWARDAVERLVQRGIILGYPDGTYRGTQNLTRYEAAVIIARVLDQIRTGDVNPGTLPAEDLTALQNAIQELAADLTALGVRVSDLEENAVNRDDFSRLEARVEELAAQSGDPAAIAGLQAQIAELTARADEFDTLRADIDDNASSIAALNDLTVLLNQDILNLQDRVSAVESAQADFVQRTDFDNLANRVGTIDTRVTTLERAPRFSVVGSIAPSFGALTLSAGTQNFDVDRLTNGTFANGTFSATSAGDVTITDTSQNFNNSTSALGLGFGIRATNLATSTGTVVVNNAAINFSTALVPTVSGGVTRAVTLSNASVDGTIAGQTFNVRYTEASNAFKFSDYLFNNTGAVGGPGFVATVNATQLPFQPALTIVGGNATSPAVNGGNTVAGTPAVGATPAVPASNPVPTATYFGVRAVVKPNILSTLGLSYAQVEGNRAAFGTDFNVTYGGVNLRGEGVLSIPSLPQNQVFGGSGTLQNAINNADKAFYTEARTDLGIAKFGANFRAIDPSFAIVNANTTTPPGGTVALRFQNNAGLSVTNSQPYSPDQTGFGAALGTTLGPIALGAYADTYTPYGGGARTTGFGAKAGLAFGALEVVGFANRVTVNNAAIRTDPNENPGKAGMDIANVPYGMSSTVGAQISHNGTAPNALVRNLNFTIANAYYYVDPLNDFSAYADYSATLGPVTIRPLARYHLASDRVITGGVNETLNTVKYGVRLNTSALTAIPLQPSAYFNVVNRITNAGTATVVNGGSTTELLGQVGVTFNQFLAPNTTASLGYSYYQGFNVADPTATTPARVGAGVGTTNQAFAAGDDRIYSARGAQSGKVDGVYAQLNFNNLSANYGIFRYTNLNNNTSSVGQGFKVSYTFNF